MANIVWIRIQERTTEMIENPIWYLYPACLVSGRIRNKRITANRLTKEANSTKTKIIVRLESCFLAISRTSPGVVVRMVVHNNARIEKTKLLQTSINRIAGGDCRENRKTSRATESPIHNLP